MDVVLNDVRENVASVCAEFIAYAKHLEMIKDAIVKRIKTRTPASAKLFCDYAGLWYEHFKCCFMKIGAL